MSDDIAIGVDIGTQGGIGVIARLSAAQYAIIAIADMPVLNDGPAGRRAVNPALLSEIVAQSHATRAFVEYVGARPGEGAVGAFAFGRSRGVVEGVLGALGVSVTFIAPASWKRTIGIPPGKEGAKDAARSEAIRRWPAHAPWFARVKDDGRAEACLIAVAGLLRETTRG